MTSKWPIARLGDHVDACLGKMLDAKKNRGSFQPYLGNSNVRWGRFDFNDLALMRFEAHEEQRYSLQDGDLVVCEGGEPGRCAIWRNTLPGMKIQKALPRVRGKDELDTQYLFYWFMHAGRTGALEPYFTGTTIKHLTGRALGELKIRLPPIEKQQSIGKILKSLDDKIDLNHRINQTLEAMAQALFKSWFVDFDPVKAKIAAIQEDRDPLRAAMSAISGKSDAELDALPREQVAHLAVTAALFPDEMEASELGEVPKGWVIEPLSKMIQLIGGGTPKRSEPSYWQGDVLWYSVKDSPLDGDVWAVDTEETITGLGLQNSSTKLIPVGATIISARGTVGKLAMVGKEMAMNQSCYGVTGANGVGSCFNYFNLKIAVEALKRNTHGAVFDTIT